MQLILRYRTVMNLMVLKRPIDVVLALMALCLFAPIFLPLMFLVWVTSPGPIFFRQVRVGLNGKHFKMLKFRSMIVDAESKLQALMVHNEVSGPVFKIRNDPRITPIGKFIRKYSLDELPQFINVLLGDMSIVGPRPAIPSEVAKHEEWMMRRLTVLPGITCIWQVSGRNKIAFDEWMKMDLEYIDNQSILLDFWLMLKTVPAMLNGR